MINKKSIFIVALYGYLWCQASLAMDSDNCASDLALLDMQVSEFGQSASEVFSMRSGMQVAQEDYKNCLESPEIYDPFKDSCQSYATEFSVRTREYDLRMQELEEDRKMMIKKMKQYTNSRGCG